MKIVGARRPGSKNISRVREISRLAKQRLKWMDHYAAHGNAALTCRYFGISRQTVGNRQKWDSRKPERSGVGLGSRKLPEGSVVLPSPFDGLGLHLLPPPQYVFSSAPEDV